MTNDSESAADAAGNLSKWLVGGAGLLALTASYAWHVESLLEGRTYALFLALALLMTLGGLWLWTMVPAFSSTDAAGD